MEAVTPHRCIVLGSAFGASELAMLFLVLGGFVAMHGIAATTATGVHHNPVVLMSAPEWHHPSVESPETGDMGSPGPSVGSESHPEGSRQPVAGPEATEGGHGDPTGSHGLMAGCLLALAGVLAAVVLRWRRAPPGASGGSVLSSFGRVMGPPEPSPPRRSRISLCVVRV